MMVFKDQYQAAGTPDEYQLKLKKNIILLVKDADVDLSGLLLRLKMSRFEVNVTWPKDGVDMWDEVRAAEPKLVVQVDTTFSKRYPTVSQDGDWDESFENRVREVMADAFVGLHHHDEFSMKDGLGTVEQLVSLLKKQGRSFCCVTNHGSVGGWVRQFNACREAGIKSVFGMEAYVSNYRGDDPEQKKLHRSANHLLMLARTEEGAGNLIRIHNDAQLNGFYYSPRANHESIGKWGRGIVGTSACFMGEISRALMDEAGPNVELAKRTYDFYKEAFDKFYVEVQIIEYEDQRKLNRRLIEFAKDVGAPLVMTCDSHYLIPGHTEAHDMMMYMRQGKTKLQAEEAKKSDDKETVWDFDVGNLYYRNASQMREVFEEGFTDKDGLKHEPFRDEVFTDEVFDEAMGATREIAVGVDEVDLSRPPRLPKLYEDGVETFRKKVCNGFRERGLADRPNANEYRERIMHEYKVIVKLGWPDYFLVMEKLVSEAKSRYGHLSGQWTVGYGRGSAAGSLVSYCLGLTECDPIEHGLLFERFLDEGRAGVQACTFEL